MLSNSFNVLYHYTEAERFQLMKIITPAYPAQNSTFNVTHSTLHVLKREFKKGREVCAKILLGAAKWEALWWGPRTSCEPSVTHRVKAAPSYTTLEPMK